MVFLMWISLKGTARFRKILSILFHF